MLLISDGDVVTAEYKNVCSGLKKKKEVEIHLKSVLKEAFKLLGKLLKSRQMPILNILRQP